MFSIDLSKPPASSPEVEFVCGTQCETFSSKVRREAWISYLAEYKHYKDIQIQLAKAMLAAKHNYLKALDLPKIADDLWGEVYVDEREAFLEKALAFVDPLIKRDRR
jgi:hypothetical protein